MRHHFESGKAVFELNRAGITITWFVSSAAGSEFFDREIEKRQQKIATERGFAISEHALYLYAECVKPAPVSQVRR